MRKAKKRKEIQFLDSVLQEVKDHEFMTPDAMIQTIDLTKIYTISEGNEIRALNGVNINIKKGEFVSVMGPSGSGKTTLLNMIGALDNPTSGTVYINRTNIAHMDDIQRTNLRLKEIGFIFQFYNLVPVLSVYENVKLPMVFAVNTGLLVDVTRSLDQGAEGVGLYRSEIPFMVRDRFPSENEQEIIYRGQLEAFAPRPVTVRTLDIGGDKALPYFPISEENPFLGWRGIRITLDHPEIFLVQIRAMLKASVGLDNLRILMPMISSVLEVEEACYLIHRAYHELLEEGFKIKMPPVGVMIEIPAAVHLTRSIAGRVDFISVGSNDLTQYLLAVDRNNARVANLYQSLHPSVLHALKYIVDVCRQENKPVSICGEMAGEPASALLLTAMGFDSLSMSASNLLKVKAAIRQVDSKTIKGWLSKVLEMDNPEIIRSFLDLEMEAEGLGSLERPGK